MREEERRGEESASGEEIYKRGARKGGTLLKHINKNNNNNNNDNNNSNNNNNNNNINMNVILS